MTTIMSSPLDKIRKLKGRSWSEIRTRGKQTLAVYTEQIGLRGKLPTDDELRKLVIIAEFGDGIITAESLFKKFYKCGDRNFFPTFIERDKTIENFRSISDEETIEEIVADAKKICEGKFDLLGHENLDFGDPLDWHLEPVSDTQSPLQHWKLFDEIDMKETGDRKIVWELNRHQYFFKLGIAYLETKDERFAAAFVTYLDGWMEQNPPGMGINWASSLEVSFRIMSWIWAFHFFKDSQSFTPGVFRKALKYLFVQGVHIEQYLSTYYSPNTHLTGEALGLYYLGTQLPFLERAGHWKELGKKILLEEIENQVLPDGVYFEQTTWYQRYTADFYLHFLILQRLNQEDIAPDESQNLETKVQSLLDFLMFSTRPDGTTPLIGDDDGGRCLPLSNADSNDFRGTLATGAAVFLRGDYKYVSKAVSPELYWLLGSSGMESFDHLEAYYPEKSSRAFSDGGYFVMRDGWSETDNYLLFDAGEVGAGNAGHGHADTLSFELAAAGKTMLVDPGTYTYHESKDLRDSFRSSAAHNTLTIDKESSSEEGGKFSWKTKAKPNVKSWLSYDRFDFVEASHDGYERLDEAPTTHSRSILFLRNEYWIMRDFVNTQGKHSIEQNFHFDSKKSPEIVSREDGSRFVSEVDGNGDGLGLFLFGDKITWQRKDGWISKHFGKRESAPFLRLTSNGTGPQEFFTFMIPQESGHAKPEVYETQVNGGRAFVVNYRDYQDLFVYADGDGQLVRTEFFDTDFRFLWARLSKGDDLPEEFVLIDGNNFSLDGRVIIEHSNKLECAIARRFGRKLHIRTAKDVFSVSLPRKRSNTYILKTPVED